MNKGLKHPDMPFSIENGNKGKFSLYCPMSFVIKKVLLKWRFLAGKLDKK